MNLLLLAAAVAASPASAASPPSAAPAEAAEARIPFPHRRGILGFRAGGSDVVYLQDRRRRWYRAQLANDCWGLPWARAIGFDTGGSSVFDRFSAIIVEGQRCPLLSLTPSERPSKRRKKG